MTENKLLELLRRTSNFKSLDGKYDQIVLSAVKAEHLLQTLVSYLPDNVSHLSFAELSGIFWLFF